MFRVSKAVGAFLISESDHMGMAYVENVWSETTHTEIRFQRKAFNTKPDLEKKGVYWIYTSAPWVT